MGTGGSIAFVTIGQSPRHDMVDEMVQIVQSLHPGRTALRFRQSGALDNLDRKEIDWLRPMDHEEVLVTRLQSGETVKVSENRLGPYMQKAVDRSASIADLVVLLCTGSFANLHTSVPLVSPDRVFLSYCFSVFAEGTIGVIVPDESQIEQRLLLWQETGGPSIERIRLEVRAASPYEGIEPIALAAKELSDCSLIALDCMGYTFAAKQSASQIGGPPVALARSVTAMAVAELL